MHGREPLLGQALKHAGDTLVFWTGIWKSLGQARLWDRPLTVLGIGPLWGQALPNPRDRFSLGIGLDGHCTGKLIQMKAKLSYRLSSKGREEIAGS